VTHILDSILIPGSIISPGGIGIKAGAECIDCKASLLSRVTQQPNMDLNYQVQASYDAGSYEQSKPENNVAQCVMPSHHLRLHERGKR
jgi:hypothetical protein